MEGFEGSIFIILRISPDKRTEKYKMKEKIHDILHNSQIGGKGAKSG